MTSLATLITSRGRHARPRPTIRSGALVGVLGLLAGLLLVGAAPSAAADTTWTVGVDTCGTQQTTTVPPGVYSMTVEAQGGLGGQGGEQADIPGGFEGVGGKAVGTFAVMPGQTITVVVGCNGRNGGSYANSATTPGWSRGGGAGRGSVIAGQPGASGGAGGGATGVCLGSTGPCTPSAGNVIVVAAGGGGGGTENCAFSGLDGPNGGNGGAAGFSSADGGGGPSGEPGLGSRGAETGGAGGVNSAGGSADGATSAEGSGGAGVNVVGGGGGGGYVGGGAGDGAATGCVVGNGGGGGSSWVLSSATGITFGSELIIDPYVTITFDVPEATATVLASSLNPSVIGDHVTFTATVTQDGAPVTDGVVDFRNGAVTLADDVPLNAAGQAQWSTSTLPLGTHGISAHYIGTPDFGPSRGDVVQEVLASRPGTVTTVVSSLNPSVEGDPVTFTATVTSGGSAVASGVVDFTAGGTVLADDVPLDGAGQAAFTTDALAVGSTFVEASYNPHRSFGPSRNSVLQVVEPAPALPPDATATSVTSSPNPSTEGEEVTFEVSVTSAGAPVTEGTVTLTEGTTTLVSGLTLDGDGTAAWRTSDLAVGSHVVTASYLPPAVSARRVAARWAPSTASVTHVVETAGPADLTDPADPSPGWDDDPSGADDDSPTTLPATGATTPVTPGTAAAAALASLLVGVLLVVGSRQRRLQHAWSRLRERRP